MLEKRDTDQDVERLKFDLERDEGQRKFLAALLGVKLEENPAKTDKPSPNNQKRTMTQEDIMRNYNK